MKKNMKMVVFHLTQRLYLIEYPSWPFTSSPNAVPKAKTKLDELFVRVNHQNTLSQTPDFSAHRVSEGWLETAIVAIDHLRFVHLRWLTDWLTDVTEIECTMERKAKQNKNH